MNRNRELLKQYEAIGSAGIFGAGAIRNEIKRAEAAISSGDTVQMIAIYKELKSNDS